jgi:hypothetical protein
VCTFGGETYAINAETTVTFDGVITMVDGGNVGVSPGTSITMVETIVLRDGIITTVAPSSAFRTPVVDAFVAAIITFTCGTYKFASSIFVTTAVTLDGAGDDLFIAGSTLVLNGGKANILWAIGTAVTLGDRSVVEGSIMTGTAMTFGAQAELRGCALAQSAITFSSAGTINLVSQGVLSSSCARRLAYMESSSLCEAACQDFAGHARTGLTFGLNSVIDGGLVGVSPGTAITGAAVFQNGGAYATPAVAIPFGFDAAFAHSAAIAHRVGSIYEGMAVEIGGKTYGPGTHRFGSAINLAASTFKRQHPGYRCEQRSLTD